MIVRLTNEGEKLAKPVGIKNVSKWECLKRAYALIELEVGAKNIEIECVLLDKLLSNDRKVTVTMGMMGMIQNQV